MDEQGRRQARHDGPLAGAQERPPAAVGELEPVEGPAGLQDAVERAGAPEHGERLVVQVRRPGQRVRRRVALHDRHAHAERVEPQRERRADRSQPDDHDVERARGDGRRVGGERLHRPETPEAGTRSARRRYDPFPFRLLSPPMADFSDATLLQTGDALTLRHWDEGSEVDGELHTRPYETVGYVLSGSVEVTVDGETASYAEGDSYLVPAGAERKYRVTSHLKAVEAISR